MGQRFFPEFERKPEPENVTFWRRNRSHKILQHGSGVVAAKFCIQEPEPLKNLPAPKH